MKYIFFISVQVQCTRQLFVFGKTLFYFYDFSIVFYLKDSLDGGVAIRFGIKEPDDTISLDSLLEVEEYQVRFQDPADAEQVFKSLDGFIDVR